MRSRKREREKERVVNHKTEPHKVCTKIKKKKVKNEHFFSFVRSIVSFRSCFVCVGDEYRLSLPFEGEKR